MFGTRVIHAFILVCIVFTSAALTEPGSQRRAMAEWWERAPVEQLGHYRIKTDLPAERVRSLARHLNVMYAHYARRLANLPPREPDALNVLIFASRDEYVQTVGTRFGENVDDADARFLTHPDFTGLAFHTEGLTRRRIETVIQHEGFHQFAYSRFAGDLPMWINEGLAQFFGHSLIADDQIIIGQPTPQIVRTLRSAIENKAYVRFGEIVTMDTQQWGRTAAETSEHRLAVQSWSMIHFLIYGENGRYVGALERYLRLINNALPADAAFRRAFGVDNNLNPFEARWRAYAEDLEPGAFSTALQRIAFLAEGALELSRRDVYPHSLGELKEALREIEFTHTLESLGGSVALNAADHSPYLIPSDTPGRDLPEFLVKKAEPRIASRHERQLENANPTPPTIATQNLLPRDLSIKWVRNPDTNTFSYTIEPK